MPKKKKGKRNNDNKDQSRELIFAEHDQVYGQATKLLGDSRCEVQCFDGKPRMCKIRGKMRKREWIKVGDVVLVSKRDFQDGKGDVIHLYTPREVRNLRVYDEIPDNTKAGILSGPVGGTGAQEEVDCAFVFDDI